MGGRALVRGRFALAALAAIVVALFGAHTAQAADFSVTVTHDDFEDCLPICTLRGAITRANAAPGADRIVFNVGTGAQTLNLNSPLPNITGPLTIDGTTQPGFLGPPLILINGAGAGATASGLRILADSTVRSLVVSSFGGTGIEVGGEARAVIVGSYIGTDHAGTGDRGNGVSGISLGSAGSTVGGTTAAARNVIAGNGGSGIEISGGSNLVQGNYIGTTAAGTAALANGARGIQVGGNSNTIGGTAAGAGNVISGSGNVGMQILAATDNVVQGNRVGTSANGMAALPNTAGGIQLIGGGSASTVRNTIGGTATGAGNQISGNGGPGVVFNTFESPNSDNVVAGNLIGTDATGLAALPNSGAGVVLSGGNVISNTIGGTAGGAGNTIAFNLGAGVEIGSGGRHRIARNKIFQNRDLGIELSPAGVTANDPYDPDVGANELQNFPDIDSAQKLGGATQIVGLLSSASNTAYRLDFYASDACDASGNGEGATWLGFENVTTNSDGRAGFDTGDLFGSEASPGDAITATATDPDGNTSEFSACETVDGGSTAGETFLVDNNTDTDDGACDETHCSLREAIGAANRTAGARPHRFRHRGLRDDPADERAAGGDRARDDRRHERARLRELADRARRRLPRGGERPDAEHRRRHGVRALARARQQRRPRRQRRRQRRRVQRHRRGRPRQRHGCARDRLAQPDRPGQHDLVQLRARRRDRHGRVQLDQRQLDPLERRARDRPRRPTASPRTTRGDRDTGANDRQNFPVLTSVERVEESLIVQGTIDSDAEAAASRSSSSSPTPECDPSGNGEGRQFLDSVVGRAESGRDGRVRDRRCRRRRRAPS